jgi:hypothetical protein
VNWVMVKSKMFAAIVYDHHGQQLYLKFRSGHVEVPQRSRR